MNEIPKRKNMTKKMRTKMINANLATILFEFKNSFEPSKDTFVYDGISGIAGIYDDNEFVVVGVFVLLLK
jgi:hypothetical protein